MNRRGAEWPASTAPPPLTVRSLAELADLLA
jgi:hypothetical protein